MTTPPPETPEPSNNSEGLVLPQNTDDKNMGLIAHGGGFLFGFLAPLLVMLLKKDSAFAQQEAKEALNFQIIIAIAAFISWILIFVLIGCILLPIVMIVDLIFVIMAVMKVNGGQPYRYPFNIRLIK